MKWDTEAGGWRVQRQGLISRTVQERKERSRGRMEGWRERKKRKEGGRGERIEGGRKEETIMTIHHGKLRCFLCCPCLSEITGIYK